MEGSICSCASAKTKKYVEENDNVCPRCGKMLVEKENDLESILKKLVLGKDGQKDDFSVQNKGVKLKPPIYNGKTDRPTFSSN